MILWTSLTLIHPRLLMAYDTGVQLPMTNTISLLWLEERWEADLCSMELYIMLALGDTHGKETNTWPHLFLAVPIRWRAFLYSWVIQEPDFLPGCGCLASKQNTWLPMSICTASGSLTDAGSDSTGMRWHCLLSSVTFLLKAMWMTHC